MTCSTSSSSRSLRRTSYLRVSVCWCGCYTDGQNPRSSFHLHGALGPGAAALGGAVTLLLTLLSVWLRSVRQQDRVRDSGHRLAAAPHLPQGNAEADSSEHPVRVLPQGVRQPPLTPPLHPAGCSPPLPPSQPLLLTSVLLFSCSLVPPA